MYREESIGATKHVQEVERGYMRRRLDERLRSLDDLLLLLPLPDLPLDLEDVFWLLSGENSLLAPSISPTTAPR